MVALLDSWNLSNESLSKSEFKKSFPTFGIFKSFFKWLSSFGTDFFFKFSEHNFS